MGTAPEACFGFGKRLQIDSHADAERPRAALSTSHVLSGSLLDHSARTDGFGFESAWDQTFGHVDSALHIVLVEEEKTLDGGSACVAACKPSTSRVPKEAKFIQSLQET